MKQNIYILGLVTALIISMGAIFKVNHLPGGGQLLILGILILVFVFLPLALRNNYRTEGNRQNLVLYWATWLTCFVVFTGMLFKILHWPGARYAIMIALPFPYVVFLPVFLVVTAKNKNFNIYNAVFVLFLLTAVSSLSALLALNASKEKIADSLVLAANYNRAENALKLISSDNRQSAVDQKIDKVIKISGEYRDLILKCYGITADQWKSDPEVLMNSEKWQVSTNEIMELGGPLYRKLKTELSDLIILLEETPGYENLAETSPTIFDMEKSNGKSYTWKSDLIVSLLPPWPLIYLDGLEINLKLLRLSMNNQS